jgi:hypothetical protein
MGTASVSVSGHVRLPAEMGPLTVHPGNPRYFADGRGRPVYLTGSHTHVALTDRGSANPPTPFDYPAYLAFLQAYGHNFIRLWAWESPATTIASGRTDERYYAPMPYERSGPGLAADGLPRFDVTKLNQQYFYRLRDRVAAARDRGI